MRLDCLLGDIEVLELVGCLSSWDFEEELDREPEEWEVCCSLPTEFLPPFLEL